MLVKLRRIHFLSNKTFAYSNHKNFGENQRVSVRCDELSYNLTYTHTADQHQERATTLYLRMCPQLGSIGYRIGRLDLPLIGGCSADLRVDTRISSTAPVNPAMSKFWAVPRPQGAYTNCTFADAAIIPDTCFGRYRTLHGPLLGELHLHHVDARSTVYLSFTVAHGWRSPGLRVNPLRKSSAINGSSAEVFLPFELSVTYAEAPTASQPFPALAALGTITSPFVVVRAAPSFAALRNDAEALIHAYSGVCTLDPSSGSGGEGTDSAPSFAPAATLLQVAQSTHGISGGKVLRVMRFRDEAEVERCAREAKRLRFQYLLIDAGWYGPELDYHSNPLSAAAIAYARRVCELATRHGLGLFLYINRRHLEQHMPVLAEVLRAAGASGLKFGFVNYTKKEDVQAVVRWAYACRTVGLLSNVHDDLIPTGLQLLLPNLLSFEAVLGNEAFPPSLHSVRLALVRSLTGPADYTPVVHNPRRVLLDVHVLCLPVMIYCPLQHLFFYSAAAEVAAAPEHFQRVWSSVPTTWAHSVWLSGHPDTHAEVARQSAIDGSWYFCAVCSTKSCYIDVRRALQSFLRCDHRPLQV